MTLTISDVPGDDPSTIASGPTVPDASTCADALATLARYRIELPPAVAQALHSGALETPKPGDPLFAGHAVHLIATPQQSLQAAAELARSAGLTAYILSDEMEGESREVGRVHAALARAVARHGQPFARPCVILSGGETTVTIRPQTPGAARGRGGRAGEFCLGLAQALQGAQCALLQAVGAACGHAAFAQLQGELEAVLEEDVQSAKNSFINRQAQLQSNSLNAFALNTRTRCPACASSLKTAP